MNNQEQKVRNPDEGDKCEIAGRLYEAIDIQRAIEIGQLTSVPEILSRLKQDENLLGQILNLDSWVFSEDGFFIDLEKTIHRAETHISHKHKIRNDDDNSER